MMASGFFRASSRNGKNNGGKRFFKVLIWIACSGFFHGSVEVVQSTSAAVRNSFVQSAVCLSLSSCASRSSRVSSLAFLGDNASSGRIATARSSKVGTFQHVVCDCSSSLQQHSNTHFIGDDVDTCDHNTSDEPQESYSINANEAAKELVNASRVVYQRQLMLEGQLQHRPHEGIVQNNTTSQHAKEEVEIVAVPKRLLKLLSTVQTAILVKEESRTEEEEAPVRLNINSLHNTLVSLSYLVQIRGTLDNINVSERLIQTLWRKLEIKQAERHLCSTRWIACIQAATILRLQQVSPLYSKICHRLTKGDAISRLTPNQLGQVLAWAARKQGREGVCIVDKNDGSDAFLLPSEQGLVRAVARRFRKQTVRRQSSNRILSKAIESTFMLLNKQDQQQEQQQLWGKEGISQDLLGELKRLAYTLLKERIQRLGTQNENSAEEPTMLTSKETASLFSCAYLVVANGNDSMVDHLCSALERNTTMDDLSFPECSSIFEALTKWRRPAPPVAAHNMGHALLIRIEQTLPCNHSPRPRDVNSIFRGVSLLHQSTVLETVSSFRNLAERLFQDKQFLNNSSMSTLSNFIWFSSTATLSEQVAHNLGNQILMKLDCESQRMSPKMACRILSSLTTWIVDRLEFGQSGLTAASIRLRDLLYQLFDTLGDYLLSKRLDPHDLSSSLVAYAKAGYALDLAIIEHVTATLASRLDDCSVRQVTQSLWAIAKMNEWELANTDNNARGIQRPLFLSHAPTLAAHLSSRASELSTKDIAQTIWAFARLDIQEPFDMLDPLLARANLAVHLMTAQETANCLWALSKIARNNAYQTVFKLTQHLRNEEVLYELKLQEATTILYALGRLDIRDEWIFDQLSQLVLSKVENTSSPAIARIFWAHRQVHLKPPQDILDAWASKKLGLIPVSNMKDDKWEEYLLND